MKLLSNKEHLCDPEASDAYVYFENEQDLNFAHFNIKFGVRGFLLPDERLRTEFQEKYYTLDNILWDQASLVNPEEYLPCDKSYGICFYAEKRKLDRHYWLISKVPCIKFLVIAIDQESLEFFTKLQSSHNLSVQAYSESSIHDQAQAMSLYELPEYDRMVTRRVGAALCQDMLLLCESPCEFEFGSRNVSYWDNIINPATTIYMQKYKFRDISYFDLFTTLKKPAWLKSREYYITFLGVSNFLKRLGENEV